MTPNNIHNLLTQMTQEQKSLWRIENDYIKEAGSEVEKKMHIEELKKLIKENI